MAKVMKSYRIEQFTLNRLSWLSKELDLSDTSVVELAITDLYMRYYYDGSVPHYNIPTTKKDTP